MSKIYKIFTKLFLIMFVIKIIEIIKSLIIASKFGVSSSADIYMAVISIPDSMLILLGIDTIRGVVNSEYSALYSIDEKEKIYSSYKNLFNILFILAFCIVVLAFTFREQIIAVLLPGFTGESYSKSVEISFVIFPILFFKVFTGYFQSIYNAFQKFYSPIILSVIVPILILISVYLPHYNNDIIYNISFANLSGNIILTLLLFYGIYKMLGKLDLKIPKFDNLTKKILINCFSLFIFVICNQLFSISKNLFASYFGKGAISSLNYASYLPTTVAVFSFAVIFSALLSNLSYTFASDKKSIARKIFINTFLGLLYVFIPIIIIFILFKYNLLVIIFLRGNFDIEGINKTLIPFFWESLSLFSYVLYTIPTALFLAKKEYKIMSIYGSSIYLFGILLNFISVRYIDFYGVTITNFIISGMFGITLLIHSRKFFGRYGLYANHFIYIILSGIITFVVFYFMKKEVIFKFIGNSNLLNILIIATTSILLFLFYLFVTHLLKVNYLNKIKEIYFAKK